MVKGLEENDYAIMNRRRGGKPADGRSEAPQCKGFHLRYSRQSGERPVGECRENCSGPWHVI
jgi:hypothetical protein